MDWLCYSFLPTVAKFVSVHHNRLTKREKERKHTGAHVVRSKLNSAWASCDLFGQQASIRSLIKLVAFLDIDLVSL
jgi:hypothetical protein